MAFAKLKAAFKRKSAANRNPGADPPAPSTTGGHGAQPSQQVSQTVAPVPGTGGGQSSQQVAQPPPPPSTSATQPSQPVSQMPAPVPHTSATPVPVPRTSSRRVPGQAVSTDVAPYPGWTGGLHILIASEGGRRRRGCPCE
ncbi:hypothetical protein F5J12DRAFT_455354 [Pisolithus orientalis]|uniref:uncharacterized protein n=1 Tax=Pisolithus orientalis TaxID=936130 RepID=UPI0022243CF1|nr:uncharacterized protein F5J12DRAFT_455354 [Pisolithus orientalis]KAI6025943.1 hypothetical protein F5J12DRAFT_455354 [Pisolithus orientalis]